MLPASADRSAAEAADAEAELRQRDREAHLYDRLVGLRLFSLLEVPLLLRLLGARRGDRIVETGCGTGRLTLPLARSGAAVLALDHSLESLRLLSRKLVGAGQATVQLVQADAARLPVCSGWGGRALASGVLQHLPSDAVRRQAIGELARVLPPGGRMALSVYQDVPLLRRVLPRAGRHSGEIPFRRLTAPELRRLLEPHFSPDRVMGALLYVLLANGVKRQ